MALREVLGAGRIGPWPTAASAGDRSTNRERASAVVSRPASGSGAPGARAGLTPWRPATVLASCAWVAHIGWTPGTSGARAGNGRRSQSLCCSLRSCSCLDIQESLNRSRGRYSLFTYSGRLLSPLPDLLRLRLMTDSTRDLNNLRRRDGESHPDWLWCWSQVSTKPHTAGDRPDNLASP